MAALKYSRGDGGGEGWKCGRRWIRWKDKTLCVDACGEWIGPYSHTKGQFDAYLWLQLCTGEKECATAKRNSKCAPLHCYNSPFPFQPPQPLLPPPPKSHLTRGSGFRSICCCYCWMAFHCHWTLFGKYESQWSCWLLAGWLDGWRLLLVDIQEQGREGRGRSIVKRWSVEALWCSYCPTKNFNSYCVQCVWLWMGLKRLASIFQTVSKCI